MIVCHRKLKVGICYESEYLLQNTFSQINGKKWNKSNESKLDATPLSKRRPCVQKLFCKRLKYNFYDKKTFHVTSRADSTRGDKSCRRQAFMHSKRKIPDSWRTGWKAKACTSFLLYLKVFKNHLYYLWHVRVLS